MKLMKHITIALVLCAIPAMAFGQTVTCDACTHDVSVFRGNGGFIAEADGADKVTWVSTCGGITQSGELRPNNDGVVMVQFMDAGLVCTEETSRMQLGPVKDGGWYWITEEANSAVGALINKNILKNTKTEITNPGPSVTMRDGLGAVLLKETATGRLGLLPTILPEPPMTALRKCGFSGKKAVNTSCALGDGGTTTLATSTNAITGAVVRIMDGATVTRPAGAGEIAIVVDLWGNGSGHFSNVADKVELGQSATAGTAARAANRFTGVTYAVSAGSGAAPPTITAGTPKAGVDYSVDSDAATVTIAKHEASCSATASVAASVKIDALMATATDADQVTPSIVRDASGKVGGLSFTVVCPGASAANQGQELVPDNPFPVE